MGYDAERAEELADMHKAGLINLDGSPVGDALPGAGPVDDFDTADEFDSASTADANGSKDRNDPKRPEAKRGRYTLPNPDSGKSKSWQRVTNFVKLSDDTYHLELWKQRNVAKGAALLIQQGKLTLAELATLEVKADKDRLNRICERAQDVADAYKMADEGTALHTSTELADYADGNAAAPGIPERHQRKVQLYLDALASHGITVVPDMIERVTASARYEVAGKFDRVYRLPDGSNVIGDVKTGDSLDLSMPSIAAQLACYEDGINSVGIFNGQRYDTDVKVRTDFGLVVHLPSTRDEVTLIMVDLDQGHEICRVNLEVKTVRRIKAKHVASVFQLDAVAAAGDHADQHWLEQMNAAQTYAQLVAVAKRAQSFSQWNDRLADQARIIAADLQQTEAGMGS